MGYKSHWAIFFIEGNMNGEVYTNLLVEQVTINYH